MKLNRTYRSTTGIIRLTRSTKREGMLVLVIDSTPESNINTEHRTILDTTSVNIVGLLVEYKTQSRLHCHTDEQRIAAERGYTMLCKLRASSIIHSPWSI